MPLPAVTVREPPRRTARAPMSERISVSIAPGWVECAGQPVTDTEPPAIIAAARKGAALERSGSIATSFARSEPAGTTHSPGAGRSTCTPLWASDSIVISMWGMLGRRSPRWMRCRPTSNRGAASSRPETN